MINTIKQIAEAYSDRLVEYRRMLHSNPELSYEEYNTSAWIKEKLKAAGIQMKEGITGNSVVGILDTGLPGKTIAFRGDMDALPLQETNDVPYRSQKDGVMHACGHDAHTAILMALAEALSEHRDMIKGKVVFLFQQGEEKGSGAKDMVRDGAMEGVDAVFGLHVGNPVHVGNIKVGYGMQSASADSFRIELIGKGSHGAAPHMGIDPITTGCSIVNEMNLIKSRLIDGEEKFVVNVCQFTAGHASNVVPERAVLQGTVRCFNEELRYIIHDHIENIVKSICAMRGCRYEMEYEFGVSAITNAKEPTDIVIEAAKECGLGVIDKPAFMGSEDFAEFAKVAPGCFYDLGSGNPEKGFTAWGHNPNFDIDEDCLPLGLTCMLAVCFKQLAR